MSHHSKFQIEKSRDIRIHLIDLLVRQKIITSKNAEEIAHQINNNERNFIKRLVYKLKNFIPIPIRHRLHMSLIGRFIGKFVKQ
jgi:hypothetical protein